MIRIFGMRGLPHATLDLPTLARDRNDVFGPNTQDRILGWYLMFGVHVHGFGAVKR